MSLRMGLQAGFGASIAADLPDLRDHNFTVVRIDCQDTRDPALAEEVLAAGLHPLVIIRSADQIAKLPPFIDVELGNEPDLDHEGWSPEGYCDEAERCVEAAEGRVALWLGAISNLNARGLRFLRQLPWAQIPEWVGCSVHRYPDDAGPFRSHLTTWLGGRRTRDDEITLLLKIVGAHRRLGLSEIGYHTAGAWTDDDVARSMAWERRFFADHGFDFAVGYQLRDGPPESTAPVDHYGFRRADGTWKPVAAAWTGDPVLPSPP